MVFRGVKFGMATSYQCTVFLYRDDARSDVLDITSTFTPSDELVPWTLAWMYAAMGWDDGSMELPNIGDWSWAVEEVKDNYEYVAGVVTR